MRARAYRRIRLGILLARNSISVWEAAIRERSRSKDGAVEAFATKYGAINREKAINLGTRGLRAYDRTIVNFWRRRY